MALEKRIETRIIELLKDNLETANFKAYFEGDPIAIPQTLLPCITVEVETTAFDENPPTGTDETHQNVLIKLIYNKKDDFNKTPDKVAGYSSLRDLAEGVDDSTGEYDAKSIVGILRKNFTISDFVLNQITSITYPIAPRPADVITQEAHINLILDKRRIVTGRS